MTRLEKTRLRRNGDQLHARIAEVEADIESIRSEYDYLDSEVLDVLCFPLKKTLEELRQQLLSNLLLQFMLLPQSSQDKILEEMRLEDQRMRGDCH